MTRIGIYAGTFDPVHEGHISFARASLVEAQLDEIYFVPERHPRHKPHASAYAARTSLLAAALHPYPHLQLLELPDSALSVHTTLPELRLRFGHTQLVLLLGADVVRSVHAWPDSELLVRTCEFVVGMRENYSRADVAAAFEHLRSPALRYIIVETEHTHISSTAIRLNPPNID